MRERSADKVKQIVELMKVLHLRVEARERVSEQGFIERIVFWIDDEKYVAPIEPVPGSTGAEEPHA